MVATRYKTSTSKSGFRMRAFTLGYVKLYARRKKMPLLGIELAIPRVRATTKTIEPLAQLIGSGLHYFL